jgi:predicted transcriptional regulator
MYYVIKKQIDKLPSTFIGFAAPKYIASKKNKNVIFLFSKDGKVIKKWVKLEDILLLTEDKEFFLKTMKRFSEVEEEQKKIVQEAQDKLKESMTNFVDTMHAELNDFEEIRNSDDVPCVLKNL